MSGAITVLYGFLGCGGLAAIAYFVTQSIGKKGAALDAVHKMTQKLGQQKVANIEKKQEPIRKKIEENEILAEETREKIKKIKAKANKQIIKTLKEDDFVKLVEKENDLW